MRRIWLAIRVFFLCLFKRAVAEEVAKVLARRKTAVAGVADAKPPAPPKPVAPKPAAPKLPARNDAVALLAALQREGRFVDFIQEPLGGYTDAQVGAVARDVHRDCAAAVQRMFAIGPAVAEPENAEVELPAGFDPGRWRLTGNVTGGPPFRGRLVHPGWEAKTCDLPTWSGTPASARVIAPAEVEL
jgi:hypothetical protein